MKIWISLSKSVRRRNRKPSDTGFSNRDGTGARLPRQEYDGDLRKETVEEFLHRQKKRNKNLKKRRGNKGLALPHTNQHDQDPGQPRDLYVKKEIWLGRRERDPKGPKPRFSREGAKTL